MDSPQQNVLAPLYSQLSGVLAGFAFAGFSILLTQDRLSANAGSVAAALFSAFSALVLLSILYTTLADDRSPHRRTIGLMVYGLPFGLAAMNLIYTLTLVAADKPELGATVTTGEVLVTIVGPVIVMARLTIAASKVAVAGNRSVTKLGWLLTAAAGTVGVTALSLVGPMVHSPQLGIFPSFVGLGVAVASGVLSAFINTRRHDVQVPISIMNTYFVAAFISVSMTAVLTSIAL